MQLNSQQAKPKAMLSSINANVMLSLIDSTNNEMLGIGIKKDPKLGEIPYISFKPKPDCRSWSQTRMEKSLGRKKVKNERGGPANRRADWQKKLKTLLISITRCKNNRFPNR